MPQSRPPRREYRGSRSARDLRSGKLDVGSSAPTGPAATEHRSVNTSPGPDHVSGGSHEPGPSNGPQPHPSVPSGPGHMRGTNRRGILIAAGAAGLAGAGGLVYDRKRRRARVSKVFVPWTGEIVEFGKRDYYPTGSNADELVENGARAQRIVQSSAARGMGRGAGGGAIAGSVGGAMAGHRGRMAGIGAVSGGLTGAYVGALGGAVHGQHKGLKSAERQGLIRRDPKRNPRTGEPVGKSGGRRVLLPAIPQSSISVRPLLARGPHVSHENDLSVTTRRGQRKGSPSALALYRSGSQTQMTGGGRAYGHRASHVGKSLDTQQYAATRGTRGTPMTDLARVSRVGRRLDVV